MYKKNYPDDHEYSRNPLVQFEEKAQRQIAESEEWLLARCRAPNYIDDMDTRPYLETLGFEIVRLHDDLFYKVVPPAGWTKSTDGYWTIICDSNGKERAVQFFKGAAYDRRAHLDFIKD